VALAPPRLRTPWSTVYYHFRRRFRLDGLWHLLLRALRAADRKRMGRNPEPSAAIVDPQSVNTVEESANIKGCDPHKKVGGRKRHLLVDTTMGLPLSICVTPANVRDQHGARLLLIGRKQWTLRRYLAMDPLGAAEKPKPTTFDTLTALRPGSAQTCMPSNAKCASGTNTLTR
jgi:hypothetical protein